MAYMNQERKAKIKANLDAALKGTGVKFSLRCDSLSITCTIKSAPIDFIANSNETCGKDFYQVSKVSNPIPLDTNRLILIGIRIITPAKPKS